MGGPIDIEQRGCGLIGCKTHIVTLNFDFTHDIDLGFSRSFLKMLYLTNGKVNQLGTKGT